MGWWGSDRIDSQLEKILARVEGRQPDLWIKKEYSGFSQPAEVKTQESVLSNSSSWSIFLRFVQNTEDGRLEIEVGSAPRAAWAYVTVGDIPLTHLRYVKGSEWNRADERGLDGEVKHVTKSGATVDYLRKWVRDRALPELAAARERRATIEQQRVAELEAMQKKYL